MIGDINFFLHPWDDDDDQEQGGTGADGQGCCYCTGEVDIMIAGKDDRGRGLGKAAVSTFLHYIWSNLDAVLGEYRALSPGWEGKAPRLELKQLMAKIKATNAHSIALFRSLGFVQDGDVNYFGEIKLVLEDLDRLASPPDGHRVLEYSRPVN